MEMNNIMEGGNTKYIKLAVLVTLKITCKTSIKFFIFILSGFLGRGGKGACPPPKQYFKSFCIFYYSKKIIFIIILLIKDLNL